MLNKHSLRTQITLLCSGLIVVTVVALLLTYWWRTSAFTQSHINRQMDSAENMLEEYLLAKERLLITAARVLTADFGFKQAVATQDRETISSALLNHGERIDADLMILVNPQGDLLSIAPAGLLQHNNIEQSITQIPIQLERSQFVYVGDALYQVMILPVRAPRLIAYTMVGFAIDEASMAELKNLTGVDLTLLAAADQVLLSTLEEQQQLAATQQLDTAPEPDANVFADVLQRSAYLHKPIRLENVSGIRAVLSASLLDEQAEFDQLIMSIVLIGIGILILAVCFSQWLVRGITQPLQQLVRLTQLIAQGQFKVAGEAQPAATELQELNRAFTTMGEEIEQRELEIKYQAERDTLTGLYNRYTLLSRMETLAQSEQRLWLIAVNVRRFKQINDAMGPDIGDSVLWVVANRLKQFLVEQSQNNPAAIACRIGADDFVLAVPVAALQTAQTIDISDFIASLQSVLNDPCIIDDLSLSLHYCIAYLDVDTGASEQQDNHGKDWLRKLTIAMSAAKKEQVDVRAYQTGEDEAYLYRLSLIEQLKQALNNDNGELFLHYQPKLTLATDRVDKLEALIRWVRREEGFISPEVFIALAEQSGVIIQLTQWVIKQVLKQMSVWSRTGYGFNVSINVSAQDITHLGFIDFLLEQLQVYNVAAERITLEITERDLMQNETLAIECLNRLKAQGIKVSVDDYGIGQSSLSKLKQLPVDELKIDKSFIMTLDESPQDQDIVSSTIALGHKLGMRVVAEGVENKPSLELLRSMQCDHVQGYYLSRPVSADDLIEWVSTDAISC